MLNIKLVSWALGLWGTGTRCLIRLSKQHRVSLRHPWFRGHALHDRREQHRLVHAGQEMNKNDWRTGFAKALAVCLNGGAIRRGPARRAGRRRQFLSPAHARGGGRLYAPAAAGFPAPGSCNVLEEESDGKGFRETSWPGRTGKAATRII
ncbi:MAG: hypothetical protein KJ946_04905 [Gammaproteobacteria bacterium]|nr:hypothetical protein [Gammaproteobacteria bacterium]